VRQTWLSRRAIGLHLVIAIVVPTFAGLCVWQVHRALDGNELSWAYVFEWPFFAGYAVYMWWRFLHEAPSRAPATGRGDPPGGKAAAIPDTRAGAPRVEDADDDAAELAAYNRYLSELALRDRRKQWR
jgi:hypothetical protein